jgi:hypothetical protein
MDTGGLAKKTLESVSNMVFPPLPKALSDALVAACRGADQELGSGFGDWFSTRTAGQYDRTAELAHGLVTSVLLARIEEYAGDYVRRNPDLFDVLVMDVDPIEFLCTCAVSLHAEIRKGAAAPNSPLTNWLVLLHMDTAQSAIRRPERLGADPVWLPTTPRRPPSSVVHRGSLAEQVIQHLDKVGRVALQGPAGMGKTTLALAVVGGLKEQYAGGVVELELGPETRSLADAESLARLLVAPAFGGRPD